MRRITLQRVWGCAALCLALAIAACASSSSPPERRVVTADEFVSPTSESQSTPVENDESDDGVEQRQSLLAQTSPTVVRIDDTQAREGIDNVSVLAGPPALRPIPSAGPLPDGEIPEEVSRIVAEAQVRLDASSDPIDLSGVISSTPIDAVVGHVNGRPLFASEFFEPMDARLRQEARRMGTEEWLRFAQDQIAIALRDRIRDELLLAELEASMSTQERQGLLMFMQRLRKSLVGQSRGSAEEANERLLEEEGITLNEKVLRERDQELVRFQLRRALDGKTFVAWREVTQQYERDRALYDLPPVARFNVIWSNDDDAARQIATRLLTGEAFSQVASDSGVNSYPAQDRFPLGVYEVSLEGGGYSSTRLFGPDVLNDAALGLEAGDIAGPIEWVIGSRTRQVWLQLVAIEDRSQDLYDVQLRIYDDLFAQRLNEAQAGYFVELISRGSLSNIDQMQQRLFRIAAERYLIADGVVSE